MPVELRNGQMQLCADACADLYLMNRLLPTFKSTAIEQQVSSKLPPSRSQIDRSSAAAGNDGNSQGSRLYGLLAYPETTCREHACLLARSFRLLATQGTAHVHTKQPGCRCQEQPSTSACYRHTIDSAWTLTRPPTMLAPQAQHAYGGWLALYGTRTLPHCRRAKRLDLVVQSAK